MDQYRAVAKLRVKQRRLAKQAKAAGFDNRIALNWRYFRATHKRASSILVRSPLA